MYCTRKYLLRKNIDNYNEFLAVGSDPVIQKMYVGDGLAKLSNFTCQNFPTSCRIVSLIPYACLLNCMTAEKT